MWEIPFIIRHEFAHHVFDHYTGKASSALGFARELHYLKLGQSILPSSDRKPRGLNLAPSEIAKDALAGINETYADIYAYFEGGAKSDQLTGVSCLAISRDPSHANTKGGASKGLTATQIGMYEGKQDALAYTDCYEPTYDDEHDIATALGYPLAQFIKTANSGGDNVSHAKAMLLWATRISQLLTTSSTSVSVDTLVRELVLTLKTDMSKNITSACTDLKPLISGLTQASAACQ